VPGVSQTKTDTEGGLLVRTTGSPLVDHRRLREASVPDPRCLDSPRRGNLFSKNERLYEAVERLQPATQGTPEPCRIDDALTPFARPFPSER
jgi:hypothetical protein